MALKGVYTALSGAMAQSTKMDTIANNIANANTPAFKKDSVTFQEYLTANEKEQKIMNVPKVPASIESFYDLQGGDKSYVDIKGSHTDFSQGSVKNTGNKFDLAIDGPGFFELITPEGVRFTRSGSFTMDGNGRLVSKEGYPVLLEGDPGDDPSDRLINVNGANLNVADNGVIAVGDQVIGRISLVEISNKEDLHKVGSSMFTFKRDSNSTVESVQNPSIKQGFLEMSNVNIVHEMTEMIKTNRVFESTQKAISAYDSMAEKLVNVVGKTSY